MEDHEVSPGVCYQTSTGQIVRPVTQIEEGYWRGQIWSPRLRRWGESPYRIPSSVLFTIVDDPSSGEEAS